MKPEPLPVSCTATTPAHDVLPSLSGTHIEANFVVPNLVSFEKCKPFRDFITARIEALSLAKVGEVYHEFPGGGYTAVVVTSGAATADALVNQLLFGLLY